MKRKFLEDLGLEKEVIDKIMAENGNDVNAAKADLENAKQQLEAANAQIQERENQLEELKKSSGDNAGLAKQIADLQAENKAAREKFESDMKDLKLNTAIKVHIAGKVHDEDIVAGLFDKSKLIMQDDGTVTGLDEQEKNMREAKGFLFKDLAPEKKAKPGYKPAAGEANKEGLAAQYAKQKNETEAGAQTSLWGAE